MGQVDPAAYFEFQRGRTIIYEADRETACLVEMDEEPPHHINDEAVDVCLTVACLLKSTPMDEIRVMRKVVIDGSTTTGFQRTCLIAVGGEVEVDSKRVPIQTICLEEDAARILGADRTTTRYRLDRMGIPLIEVATAPVIESPEEAVKAALTIGRILRDTGKVRRGLGAIRQDINVSLEGGALVEVKGVQRLDQVSKVVEYEIQRQQRLIQIRDELMRRGATSKNLEAAPRDLTHILSKTSSEVIQQSLERGGVVLAVPLPNFAGLLREELIPGLRFGTELSDHAKFWGRVGGIFHSDELPGYGISGSETEQLRAALNLGEGDGFAIVSGPVENCRDALTAVLRRAAEALEGVPEETRAANPDGTTRYMRPRPGAARMYPETDIPSMAVSGERLSAVRSGLPETSKEKSARLVERYGLNRKLVEQLLSSDFFELFEEVVERFKVNPTLVAVTLTETLKSLARDGVEVDGLTDGQVMDVFNLLATGELAKEAIPDLLRWVAEHRGRSAREGLKELGLQLLSVEELSRVVDRVLDRNAALIEERGAAATGPLTGLVMSEVRGRADAKSVGRLIGERIGKRLTEKT